VKLINSGSVEDVLNSPVAATVLAPKAIASYMDSEAGEAAINPDIFRTVSVKMISN